MNTTPRSGRSGEFTHNCGSCLLTKYDGHPADLFSLEDDATKWMKTQNNFVLDPTPVCVDHDHDFNTVEPDYSSEDIEVSDDEGAGAPIERTKRSYDYNDDDSDNDNEKVDDSGDLGYGNQSSSESEEDGKEVTPYSYRNRNSSGNQYRSRFPTHNGHRRYQSGNNDEANEPKNPRRHKIMTTRVRMPTSEKRDVRITVPNMRGWKCGIDKTKLIILNPNGKMGSKEYNIVVEQMEKTKQDHPGSGLFKSYNVIKIEKVVNGCFWKKYKRRQEVIHGEVGYVNERMLFHGTSKVKELLEFGFDERYANINGMFGAGVYFAKHSSKSNQYAFGVVAPCTPHKDTNCDICERQIMLCRVTMGKVKDETAANKRSHPPPGYHSVKGVASPGGLKYNEYIVYRGEQVYAEYVITYKIVK